MHYVTSMQTVELKSNEISLPDGIYKGTWCGDTVTVKGHGITLHSIDGVRGMIDVEVIVHAGHATVETIE